MEQLQFHFTELEKQVTGRGEGNSESTGNIFEDTLQEKEKELCERLSFDVLTMILMRQTKRPLPGRESIVDSAKKIVVEKKILEKSVVVKEDLLIPTKVLELEKTIEVCAVASRVNTFAHATKLTTNETANMRISRRASDVGANPARSRPSSFIVKDDFIQPPSGCVTHQVDRAHFLDEFYHSIYPEQTIYDTKENPREGSKGNPETTPRWSGTC
ncbi:hypothetical protein pipiens_008497 [Culex pipiens pipiens]|uniref:Uncharacterized protein n=1 Tax=Culex pipiens pipiens TaxID=38569 RepID=A0ABD1DH87_CULPP